MLNSPTDSTANSTAKDALERLYNWIDVLEKRVHALVDANDVELMTPAHRQQAANRYLMIWLRFLQQRQEYVVLSDDSDDPAQVDAPIFGHDEKYSDDQED